MMLRHEVILNKLLSRDCIVSRHMHRFWCANTQLISKTCVIVTLIWGELRRQTHSYNGLHLDLEVIRNIEQSADRRTRLSLDNEK